jgi:RHS repeat-associated protein
VVTAAFSSARYTWALDLAGSLTATGGVGALVQITDHTNGASYCPTYDGNGNVASLLNTATGSDRRRLRILPLGRAPPLRGLLRHQQPLPLQHQVHRRRDRPGLLRRQILLPSLGRFINRDPIEEAGGLNLYGFCRNDAINGVPITLDTRGFRSR